MSLGAAIAFFTVFSLAPMLLVAIAVAGLAFGREAAQGAIVDELGGLVGGQTGAALEGMIASAGNFESGMVGLAVGVATFLFLATGAVIELQDNLNIIWKVKPPESYGVAAFIRTRILSLTLIVGFGFLLMVSLVLDAGLTSLGVYLESGFSGASMVLRILNSAVAFAIAVLLFAMIFKILPAVELTWARRLDGRDRNRDPLYGRQVRDRVLHREERRRFGIRRRRIDRHYPALDLLLVADPALRRRVHQDLRRKPRQPGPVAHCLPGHTDDTHECKTSLVILHSNACGRARRQPLST
jgi:hypothetical protein